MHTNTCQTSGRTRTTLWKKIVTLFTDVTKRRGRAYVFMKTTPKLKISLHLFLVSLCFQIYHSGKYLYFIREQPVEDLEIFLNRFTSGHNEFKF